MKILHLLSASGYNAAAKQALLLARGLAADCVLRVCVLQDEGPWAADWRQAGVAVRCLHGTGPINALCYWRLRRLLRDFEPDRIHVWRLPALRALALAGRGLLPCCIVSQALPCQHRQTRLGMLDRWLLRHVARIVAGGPAEAESLRLLGFGPAQVTVIPPGVEIDQIISAPSALENPVQPGTGKNLDPPREDAGRRIVCLGNLERNKGFREALRAADYLTYAFPDLRFDIIGTGPFLPSLERFREGVYHQEHMHFLGARADAAAWLATADVCWVPSLAATGRQVALEALAAGRPVVASDLPHFREIIVDGETGCLVCPGDAMALARRTRQLFLDETLRRRLGEAGRERVRAHFKAGRFIAACSELYGLEPPRALRQSARAVSPAAPAGLRRAARRQDAAEFSIAIAAAPRNNALSEP